MGFVARRLLACCCLLFASTGWSVDFTEPRGDLALADAIGAALLRNPELRSAGFAARAAQSQLQQAGLRPNPELAVEIENFGGSGALRGGDSLETTLSLSQVIELGDKRRRRVEAASFGRDDALLEREAKALDVLAEVTRRFIAVAAQQERLALARRALALSEQTLRAIEIRVAAARVPVAEQSRAAIALSRARLEEQHATHGLASARQHLAATWGSTEPRFGDVRAELFELPAAANFEGLLAGLKTNPDFLRFANAERLHTAELRLAQAQARSDLTVGAGVRRFEETGDTGLVLNFSMPLPLANRNQGAIGAAQWRREQVQSDQQAAFVNAHAALFDLYQELQHARYATTSLRGQLIAQAENALAQTRYGYERGRFSYLELADAQRELLELQSAAIEAAANYHLLYAEIERLTHAPLNLQQDQ
jgi:outer membrane protein, heavy metal efflux system